MGMEYTLRFAHTDAISVVSALKQLPMVYQLTPNGVEFELRALETTGSMPDAFMTVEPSGLYFCDYGGTGGEFLGRVIACLVSHFGPITIEDRE
jgi:hypothetical protein